MFTCYDKATDLYGTYFYDLIFKLKFSVHSRFPMTRFPVTRLPFYERVTVPHNEQTINAALPLLLIYQEFY